MNILTEIYRRPGVDINGKAICRTAVRAVVLNGRKLLMIHSANVGDYKFPGGGVAEGETYTQALCREIQEECGTRVSRVGEELAVVVEYDAPIEKDYDVFKMTSLYYRCDVDDEFGAQTLDDYEQELGFTPTWIDVGEAIQANKALLDSDQAPEWLKREIIVLEYIRQALLSDLTPGT